MEIRLTNTEYFYHSLVKALFWRSHGRLSKPTREYLAKKFVDTVDFNDPKAMHKSMEGYADIILDNFYHRNADAYQTLKRL